MNIIFLRNLVVFLFLDTFEYRKCQETGEMTKCLENDYFFLFPDPFSKGKVSRNRETTKSLEYGKCLETGKRQNPLNMESVWKQGKQQNPLDTESV